MERCRRSSTSTSTTSRCSLLAGSTRAPLDAARRSIYATPRMTDPVKTTLLAQLEIAWALTQYHLEGLTTERPFGDIVAWVNLELMKNAAELGYARFVLAVSEGAA